MNKKTIGVAAILTASVMWAIEPILVRYSYVNSNFIQTTAMRAIFITLIALIYAFATNKGNLKINRKQFSALAYIAISSTVIGELIYLYALGKSPIVNVVLLGHTQPVFIVLMGIFLLKKDKLTIFDYFGIFFMVVASLLVSAKSASNMLMLEFGTITDLMVLFAAFLWAISAIVARKYLSNMNAGVIVFYRYVIASIILVAYLFFASSLNKPNIYQIFVGVVIGIGIILYYESLKRIKAAQVGALELVSPFFAAMLGFMFFKESVTIMQIAGMILMLIGVNLLAKKEE